MITIKNVKTLDNQITDYSIPSEKSYTIEAEEKILLFPGIIDPHIYFGPINREWNQAISSAIRGGITTVIEIPGEEIPCNTKESIEKKRKIVESQLSNSQISLHYHLYAKAECKEVKELGLAKKLIKGVIIQSDPRKKEELDNQWEQIFQMAAWENLPVIVNAFNENTNEESGLLEGLLEKAIYYTEKEDASLYVLNVSNQQEINLIQEGRKKSLLIFAETTPRHLFQQNSYNADCLWKAIDDGIIETIGSGYYADQWDAERILFKGGNFSFSNPIFLIPLLFTAHQEGKVPIDQIVRLLRYNVSEMFEIQENHDAVLIDLEKEQGIQRINGKNTKNMTLKGWPMYTIAQGHLFPSPDAGCHAAQDD